MSRATAADALEPNLEREEKALRFNIVVFPEIYVFNCLHCDQETDGGSYQSSTGVKNVATDDYNGDPSFIL